MKIFYVYEHWRPDLDVCFYVGKGKRHRAYKIIGRNVDHAAVVASLSAAGLLVEVRIVAHGLSEAEAFSLERHRIMFWKSHGIVLANRTDGGEGFSGIIRPKGIRLSEEAKRKVSLARKGMKFSMEHREKLAHKKRGVPRAPFKPETIKKMRIASLAREAAKRALHGDNVTRRSRLS